MRNFILRIIVFTLLFVVSFPDFAAEITVTSNLNDGPGTLREAVSIAEPGDNVVFSLTLPATILLDSQIVIQKSISIIGPVSDSLIISGQNKTRIFDISNNAYVFLENLYMTEGYVEKGFFSNEFGGAIRYIGEGRLDLKNCAVYNNFAGGTDEGSFGSAQAFGGGICFKGSGLLRIENSIISFNTVRATAPYSLRSGGAGIYIDSLALGEIINSRIEENYDEGSYENFNSARKAGELNSPLAVSVDGGAGILIGSNCNVTIKESALSQNLTNNKGGGIANYGILNMETSVLMYNEAFSEGGGIYTEGNCNILNSTLSGNRSYRSGAIFSLNYLFLDFVTITGNFAMNLNAARVTGIQGGTCGGVVVQAGSMQFSNTIIALNSGYSGSYGPDISNSSAATISSNGYNLVGLNIGNTLQPAQGDMLGTLSEPIDPLLGPLQDNGGNTYTHALLPGSPAIDAGDPYYNSIFFTQYVYDQRGIRRTGRVDIGSFEIALCYIETYEDYFEANHSEPTYLDLHDNDHSSDGTLTQFQVLTQPLHGILDNNDGISYMPESNFFGFDSLQYKVCNNCGNCDSAWVYLNVPEGCFLTVVDDSVSLEGNSSVNIVPGINDTIPKGQYAVLYISAYPQNGYAIINSDTAFEYFPYQGFSGRDTVEYEICMDACEMCRSGYIYIEVTTPPCSVSTEPDYVTAYRDEDTYFNVQYNDYSSTVYFSSIDILTDPLHGSLTVSEGLIYTPDPGFFGFDSLYYKACNDCGECDSTWVYFSVPEGCFISLLKDSVSVNKNSTIEILPLSNDTLPGGIYPYLTINSNPLNGTAVLNSGSIEYISASGFTGKDSIEYRVCIHCDLCQNGYIYINVTEPPPAPPQAVKDTSSAPAGAKINISILLNDLAENDTIDYTTLVIAKPPVSGATVKIIPGTPPGIEVDYSNIPDFEGKDTLAYSICTVKGLCDTALVTINVLRVAVTPPGIPGIVVYNVVSANGDGIHDFLEIGNIEYFPKNLVEIYNRWGNKVFEISNYDNDQRNFKGFYNLGNNAKELPEGTYYYSINLNNGQKPVTGFLVFKR